MNQRSIVRALSVACVGLMFAFMADTVDAQRRGGGGRGGGGRGGGGGGRSISRSGPASGGSFRPSRSASNRARPSTGASTRPSTRPSTQPATRPSTGAATRPSTQPATRPSTGASTRPGAGGTQLPSTGAVTRPGQGTTRPGEGTRPGDGTRPGQGEGDRFDGSRREDWQDYGNAAREDWQDFYEEGGGGYYYGGYYGHPGYYDYEENDDWVVLISGMAIGSAMTSASFNSMKTSTGCSLSEVTVNGVHYFKCGDTWYNKVIDGTNVNYIKVNAPPGY